jgi:antitoxin component of MazEF toxin-antitoxin module
MKSLELIEVGEEVGMIFPQELLTTLQVGLGDDIELTPTEGGFLLRSNSSGARFFFQRCEKARG